jgi:hypothetical protein
LGNEKGAGLDLTVANSQNIKSGSTGNVFVQLSTQTEAKCISDVVYIPDLSANLLSVSRMKKQMTVVFSSRRVLKLF